MTAPKPKLPKHLKRRRALRQQAVDNQYKMITSILDRIATTKKCTAQEWELVKHLFNKTRKYYGILYKEDR